ncbi:MAG TPA: hypothetical protein VFI19_04155 [Nocardioides sp.]|nr:hypothetical protein [Nocardioides sp.]
MAGLPTLRRTAARTVWRDAAWPALAGAVAAAGLLGVWHLTGLVAVVLMVAGLWVLFAVTLYGVVPDWGLRTAAAVRIGLLGSVWTVSLLGLVALLPVAGWLVALAVGVTAPAVTDWAAPRVHRAIAAARPSRTAPRVDSDQGAVDRAFEQIVTELDNDSA